jgi:predicted TPR repeat methyltransferase
MPTSAIQGKIWTVQTLLRLSAYLNFAKILDVGPGHGTYSLLLRSQLPQSHWSAVEIWEPYVERFGLEKIYDEVLIQDIREYAPQSPAFDLVLLGDVIEHMTQIEAQKAVEFLLQRSQLLLISIPIIDMPQAEVEGNPYERHIKADWNHAEVLRCWGEYLALGRLEEPIGVYLLTAQLGVLEVIRLLCGT